VPLCCVCGTEGEVFSGMLRMKAEITWSLQSVGNIHVSVFTLEPCSCCLEGAQCSRGEA
jgi:hypothetical protein